MNKKTSIYVFIILVVAAIFMGLLMLNKSDGPVTGMILADRPLQSTSSYGDAQKTPDDSIFLVISNAFNKFQEDYKTAIPENESLYATVHFVECPQGSTFTAKWILNSSVIQQEEGTLLTGPEGVITYTLDGVNVKKGSYTFQLFDGEKQIFETAISVE